MSAFAPSHFQTSIFDFVTKGSGSAIVEAVAGSGKTTVITHAVKLIPANQTVLMLAFNKVIAEELSSRINLPNVEVKTFHSLGFSAYKDAHGTRVKMDNNKLFRLINDLVDNSDLTTAERAGIGSISKIVKLGKSAGIGTKILENTEDSWLSVMEHHDVSFTEDGEDLSPIIPICQEILARSNSLKSIIDFDDMIYMPVQQGLKFRKFDWVFVDESQDVSHTQRLMLKALMKPTSRMIAVGDPCQPPGTIVDTPNGKVNIEDLKVGDLVTSYSISHATYIKNGKKVTGITHKDYDGELIVAKTENNTSKYTTAHHCLVKLPSDNRYVTYIMRRGNDYRVGMSKMRYSAGFGPLTRMRQESGDAIWVLDVFDNKIDASISEQVTSAKFGISQLTFSPVNSSLKTVMTSDTLDKIWHEIGENSDRASKCLESFGRNIKYPLVTKGENYAARRPVITRACNLFDGMQVRVYTGNTHARIWTPISVSRENYVGTVISMDVEDTHLYIGDGIVTHNCQAIYGFRGADSTAMAGIAEEFSAVTLPLSISYRCPQTVVAEAQKWVSHIQASPTADEGTVVRMGKYSAEDFSRQDAVICRNVAPLIKTAYSMISRNIPVNMLGRDIGKGLISLIKTLKAKTIIDLDEKLSDWADKEMSRLSGKGENESKMDSVNDKVDCIKIFISQATKTTTVQDLIQKIESFFSDEANGNLTLCTIHKAKGKEWERIFILDESRFFPKWAKKEWMKEQEKNIVYVAVTRAKKDLIFIQSNNWKD
jgi:superfamily I DNA/RNA helicase